jgi:hypothetical protein
MNNVMCLTVSPCARATSAWANSWTRIQANKSSAEMKAAIQEVEVDQPANTWANQPLASDQISNTSTVNQLGWVYTSIPAMFPSRNDPDMAILLSPGWTKGQPMMYDSTD